MKKFNPLRKRNVLHVVTAMSWRGGEQQVAYLLEELEGRIQQTVFCMQDSAMHHFCENHGFGVVTHPKRIKMDPTFALQIKKACLKLEIDLCHLHDAHAHTMAILAAGIFGNDISLILSRRVDFPIGKSFLSRYKYNHSAIKKILCVSNKIREIIRPDIQEQQKLETVYSGIDIDKFNPRTGLLRKELELQDSEILIGNTSALADHKDYFTFMDVAERLLKNHDQLRFVIIGDGPQKESLIDYAKERKLGSKLVFVGFRRDLPQILADLDVFLITSKTEGLGTSILDAFASGVPVVGTAAGGIPELIENQKTGLLCPVRDVDCLSNAIEGLMDSPGLREKLVQAAGEKVKSFSKRETSNQTLKQYQSIWD